MVKIYYQLTEKIKHYGASLDKLALAKDEAVEFAHKYINDEPKLKIGNNYSWEHKLAYHGEYINSHYRQNKPPEEWHKEIATGIAKITTQKDIVVYRGVTNDVFDLMKQNAKGIRGANLVEKSFMQTSLAKDVKLPGNIKLRIYVPKGTHAVYLGNVNDEEERWYEVAIQHGAKLKILSIDNTYINCRLLESE